MKKKLLSLAILALTSVSALAQITTILTFSGTANGEFPLTSFYYDGTYLYGTTLTGGANNDGTIFKILPNGSSYTKLLDFAGTTNGSRPECTLISDGTYLYGMTASGGANNMGTIFKILPNGTGYVDLFDFAGTTSGQGPNSSLYYAGTYLYGTTEYGGANNMGTLFKILPNGTSYTKLLDFAGTTNGAEPFGTLISDGVYLYGTTNLGGANNLGTIFKILPNGTGFTKILDFAGTTNGKNPIGALCYGASYLYGMTEFGGANNVGTIFKIFPDGTGYTDLLDFNGTNGSEPMGDLFFDGNYLYGMTNIGGINNNGLIFKILTNGTSYVDLGDFNGAGNGANPYGALYSDGTYLYGTTSVGGANNVGTVFKLALCTSHPTITVNNGSICNGQSFTISPSGANTYTYSSGSAVITPTTSATYSVTGTDVNGCVSLSPAISTVTVNALPIVTITASSTTICSGSATTITAGGITSYSWSTAALTSSISVNPTSTTVYSVSGANAQGCIGTGTVDITVDICTGIEQLTVNNERPSIYPNPANNIINVYSKLAKETEDIQITNILGQEVMKATLQQGKTSIDVITLPQGTYFIKIGLITEKFTKQ